MKHTGVIGLRPRILTGWSNMAIPFWNLTAATRFAVLPGHVLFTGRYSTETGLTYNNIGIDKDVPNMGQWFEKYTDYDRVYCGKWHAGGKWNYPDTEGARKIPGFETIPVGVLGTGDFNDFQVSGALRGYIQNHDYDKPFLAVAGLMNPHDICYWTQGDWGRRLVPSYDLFKLGDKLPPIPPNFILIFRTLNRKCKEMTVRKLNGKTIIMTI